MNKPNTWIPFLYFCCFATIAQTQHIPLQYEKCECTNNSFTNHITEPYQNEIEQWFIDTALPIDKLTEAQSPCLDCAEKEVDPKIEEGGWFTDIFNTLSKWKDNITDSIGSAYNYIFGEKEPSNNSEDANQSENSNFNSSPNSDTSSNLQDLQSALSDSSSLSPSPNLPSILQTPESNTPIPLACFQASASLAPLKPQQREDLHTCLRYNYDGSEQHCEEIKPQNKIPLYDCHVLPISCKDVNNPEINCNNKFKERDSNCFQKNCDEVCNKGSVYSRRPCLNKNYLALMAKALHDVSQCFNIPIERAFSMFSHESRFIINDKSRFSSTNSAFCATQVTGPAIADFNSFIDGKPFYPHIKELLPENINTQCPEVWKLFQRAGTKKSKNQHLLTHYGACTITTNPYSCMFYGMAYIKILENKVDKAVQSLNKVAVRRTPLSSSQTILWDEQIPKDADPESMEYIKIFQDENHLKSALYIITYNGGPSITSSVFPQYMNKLENKLKEDPALMKKFLDKNLTTEDFLESFLPHIREHYPSSSTDRKQEVSNYLKKIQDESNLINQRVSQKYNLTQGQSPLCPPYK